jgi:hypothetical protein
VIKIAKIMTELIYQDEQIESFTESTMRGHGVVEILLNGGDFTILNEDGSLYERIIFTETEYEVTNATTNFIARKVILNMDFFTLQFDCDFYTDKNDFVTIYLNGEKKKIKRKLYQLHFLNWEIYVMQQYIKIKNTKDLKTEGYFTIEKEDELIFRAKEIQGDELYLISTSTACCSETKNIEGKARWRNKNELLIDICIID